MILTMTPLRVSFLGGGTDFPEYFHKHGGAILGTSIDKYTYISVSPLTRFFDYKIRVGYSKTELVQHVDEIQHPSVRECLKFMGIHEGVEINVVSDLPARTGLGSSSCFTVGLLHALHAFKGEMVDHEQLAREAVHIERECIGERVGMQDQYICANGGLLNLVFSQENSVNIRPVVVKPEKLNALQERLMIFYTGLQRMAHEVLEEQMERTKSGDAEKQLEGMRNLVSQGLEVLSNGHKLEDFGDLLHQGWQLKSSLSSRVSNQLIDQAYQKARTAGAIGGKLLGAGGGGFLLLYAEPYNHEPIRKVLADLREVKFGFENQGSRLVFYRK